MATERQERLQRVGRAYQAASVFFADRIEASGRALVDRADAGVWSVEASVNSREATALSAELSRAFYAQ